MALERLLRFTLGQEVFALALHDAGSLVRLTAASPVPRAPGEIAGVADIRGRVVTLVRLTRLAGLPDPGIPPRRAVVLAAPLAHLGLEVGDDVDLLVTDLGQAREVGERGTRGSAPYRGLLTAEGLLLNLIDPPAVAAACERRVRERSRLAG